MSFNKLKVRLDLSKAGLGACFKEFQQIMLDYVWANANQQNPISNMELWEAVNEKMPEGESRSRASVINSGYKFSDELGIWAFKVVTGKGGHKRLYYAAETEAEFWERVGEAARERVNESAGKQIL